MTDFVSNQWSRVVALATATLVGCAILIPAGLAWTGLLWMSLAFSVALWLDRGSRRTMTQVIHDVEAEPLRAVASPVLSPHRRRVGPGSDKETAR
jgi:hypothetical protein